MKDMLRLFFIAWLFLVANTINAQCPLEAFSHDIEHIDDYVANHGSEAWYALYKSGATSSTRRSIGDLEYVEDYLTSTKRKADQVSEEIISRGGFNQWKVSVPYKNFANTKSVIDKIEDLEKAFPGTKARFIEDFGDATEEVVAKFADNPDLVDAWKKMGDLNADEAIRKNVGALEALNKPKFDRPNPSDYLSQSYIDNHLFNFNGGVTKITAQAPTGPVGPPTGGTFVLPKSQADDLIAQAGGDVNKLEDLLGLDRGTLGSNPVRIDVDNPSELRMPDGNEFGANDKWIPGGKLLVVYWRRQWTKFL